MKPYGQAEEGLAAGSPALGHRAEGHRAEGHRAVGLAIEDLAIEDLAIEGLAIEVPPAEGYRARWPSARGRLAETRATRLAEQRRPCALVVDRDPDVLRALANCLSPELDVQVAGSALRAEAVLAQITHVDLAFLELDLPATLGEELLQQLGRWPDAIRVLLARQAVARRELPRNRYLAHLVLSKPVSLPIVQALKRATLGLPRD